MKQHDLRYIQKFDPFCFCLPWKYQKSSSQIILIDLTEGTLQNLESFPADRIDLVG